MVKIENFRREEIDEHIPLFDFEGAKSAKFSIKKKVEEDVSIDDVTYVREHPLSFLPAKSHCKFRTGSKERDRWIISPFLALKQSTNFKDISCLCCQLPDPSFISYVHPSQDAYSFPSPSLDFLPKPVDIRTSFNGLLCCQSCCGDDVYYICHPVAKTWKELPKPELHHGSEVAVALAFEPDVFNFPASFKLVCAVTLQDIYFEIYSSSTSSWTLNPLCCDLNGLKLIGDGFYSRGIVYWKTLSASLLAFDLKKGESRIMSLPPSIGPNGVLTEMHGELCYILPQVQYDACTIEVYGIMDNSLNRVIALDPQAVGHINGVCRSLTCFNDGTLIIILRNRVFAYHVVAQEMEMLSSTWADGYTRIRVNVHMERCVLEQSDLDRISSYFDEGSAFFRIFCSEILPLVNLKDVFRFSAVTRIFNKSIRDMEYNRVILNGTVSTMVLFLSKCGDHLGHSPVSFFANQFGGQLIQTHVLNRDEISAGSVIGNVDDWLCFSNVGGSINFACLNTKNQNFLLIPSPWPITDRNSIRAGFGFSHRYCDYRISALIYTEHGRKQFVYSLNEKRWIPIKAVIRWRDDLPKEPPVYLKGQLYWYDLESPNFLVVYSLEKNQYYPLSCTREGMRSQGSRLSVIRNKLTIVDSYGSRIRFYGYKEHLKVFELLYTFDLQYNGVRFVKPIFVMLDDSVLCLLNNERFFSFNLRSGIVQWHPIAYPVPRFNAFSFFGQY